MPFPRAYIAASAPPSKRARAPGSDWEPEKILSAFVAIDARLRKSGPFTAQGDHPGDKAILVDWSLRAFWHRAIAAIHHASGGSEAGFELSCQVSGGDSSMGLVGCPSKFDRADQRRVWDSMSTCLGPLRSVTMGTIYWIARDFADWTSGRRGRPMEQPRESGEIPAQAQAVADAGRWAVSDGLNRVRKLHAIGAQRLRPYAQAPVARSHRNGPRSSYGRGAIGSLTLMAGKLGCDRETVRRYLRELEQEELIIKNRGNATSMPGTRGIIIALAFREGILEAFDAEPDTLTADPPISDQTGKTTPDFQAQAGWNPSRSPSSHEDDDEQGLDALGVPQRAMARGDAASTWVSAAALWCKPDLTLGDWTEAGVIHAEFEFGDHLERMADKRGRGAVSRVLVRLKELRTLRKSSAEIRCDAERAA